MHEVSCMLGALTYSLWAHSVPATQLVPAFQVILEDPCDPGKLNQLFEKRISIIKKIKRRNETCGKAHPKSCCRGWSSTLNEITSPCFHLLRRLKEKPGVEDLLHKLTGCLLQYLSDAAAGW